MPSGPLKSNKLSKSQILWLECVKDHGGYLEAMEVLRILHKEIESGFDARRNLDQLMSGGHITIFGLYKLDPKDPRLLHLHNMVLALKNGLAYRKGHNRIFARDFSKAARLEIKVVDSLLANNYFFQYWIDNNDQDATGYAGTKDGHFYDLSPGALQRLDAYIGLDDQIEARWRIATGRIGGLNSVDPLPAGVFSAEIAASLGLPTLPPPDAVPVGSGWEVVKVDLEGLICYHRGKGHRINKTQGLVLDACYRAWLENGERPVDLSIEKLRIKTGEDISGIARVFSRHSLRSLFKMDREANGIFRFEP